MPSRARQTGARSSGRGAGDSEGQSVLRSSAAAWPCLGRLFGYILFSFRNGNQFKRQSGLRDGDCGRGSDTPENQDRHTPRKEACGRGLELIDQSRKARKTKKKPSSETRELRASGWTPGANVLPEACCDATSSPVDSACSQGLHAQASTVLTDLGAWTALPPQSPVTWPPGARALETGVPS